MDGAALPVDLGHYNSGSAGRCSISQHYVSSSELQAVTFSIRLVCNLLCGIIAVKQNNFTYLKHV